MRDLRRLLRPKSIVVVGGGAWCENVIRECRKNGFGGDICAVHPSKKELSGSPAVRSVAELPFVPDAAFVGVNRHSTIEIVQTLAKIGAGGAVCFASGFKEASAELEDADNLQDVLVEAAGEMPILGPNCYGFINALDGAALWPDQHGLVGVPNGVAILTQSSNIALNLTMQKRGLPIAYLATAGNQAQTGLSAIAEALLGDERVTAIGLYVEGLDDLSAFETFARRAKKAGKPVVVLKIGRSAQARSTTMSHTASLAGSAVGASALFSKLGIAEVTSLSTFLETLKMMHMVGTLAEGSIVSMSCSGGEASLVADLASDRNITFPVLSATQKAVLNELLGDKVALANPLDYHTYIWRDVDSMSHVFSIMMEGEASFGVVVLDFPRSDRCDLDDWLQVIDAVEIAKNKSGKPMGILSSLQETMPEAIALELFARGVVPLCGLEDALAAIASALDGLQGLSRERVGAELVKLLAAVDPAPSVATMMQTGVLHAILPGTDARALAPLVDLEAQHQTAPDAIRRLAALGMVDGAALRLSKKDQRRLELYQRLISETESPAELAYRHGATAARDVVLLRSAMLETPVPGDAWARIDRGATVRCPVTAKDLMPVYQGAQLGEKLRQIESHWIASDFTLTRNDLLD